MIAPLSQIYLDAIDAKPILVLFDVDSTDVFGGTVDRYLSQSLILFCFVLTPI